MKNVFLISGISAYRAQSRSIKHFIQCIYVYYKYNNNVYQVLIMSNKYNQPII